MTAASQRENDKRKPLTSAEKEADLRRLMREMGRVLVAYSGGVDSSYLALVASQELADDAIFVMGDSASVSEHQREAARSTAEAAGFRFSTIPTGELSDVNYVRNDPDRCYFCKTELYSQLTSRARDTGIAVILDGTNADDLADHRPGRRAAAELGVRSPLAELGFTKEDIRERSRHHGLTSWDRPASPCLSSRVAHGVPVTIGRLSQVERGEVLLRRLGLKEFRVRVHGEVARLEVAQGEMRNLLDLQLLGRLNEDFRALGFKHVTLDLGGFRSGSMNPNVP